MPPRGLRKGIHNRAQGRPRRGASAASSLPINGPSHAGRLHRPSGKLPDVGGHLLHLVHWLHAESEYGGPLAIVGILAGLVIGYTQFPVLHPAELCTAEGIGRDAFGNCPDFIDFERLFEVLTLGLLLGFFGLVLGYIVRGGKSAE